MRMTAPKAQARLRERRAIVQVAPHGSGSVDVSTVWQVETDLALNEPLREKVMDLVLALARRMADDDHDEELTRRAEEATRGAALTPVAKRKSAGNRHVQGR